MPQTVQVGTILLKESPLLPELLGLEIQPYSGNWSLVEKLDGFALDRKIRGTGWNISDLRRGRILLSLSWKDDET